MPCHNRDRLPKVIDEIKQSSFAEIDGISRIRILAELEKLSAKIEQGAPLDYTQEATVHQNFKALPGALYTLVERGEMPPPWAPELMQKISGGMMQRTGWFYYEPLSWERRIDLLRYAKPYSERYLR